VIPQATFFGGTLVGICAPFVAGIVPIVFGSEFADAAVPLVVLLIPATLLLTANLQAPVILLHEETTGVGCISLLAAGVNIIGDVVLIGWLGLGGLGAALATTLAILVMVAGYSRIVSSRAGTALRVRDALLLAPLLLGTTATSIVRSWTTAPVIAIGVVALSLAFIAVGGVFEGEDVKYVEDLRLPAAIKDLLLRFIRLAPER
jgi:O-antigen/teichoic acid export membrane protein